MKYPEKFRLQGEVNDNGLFAFTMKKPIVIMCIAATGMGWEHVSVSIKVQRKDKKSFREAMRCPTWSEMHFVKQLFWEDEECVMQLHPPKSQYVSTHPYVLHLWKPIDSEIQTPPNILVGIPGDNKQ